MSRGTRQPTEVRRRQIADAALQIVAFEGAHRLTAAEIAQRVGMADGSLFRHFSDMQAIIRAATERLGERLSEDLEASDPQPLRRLRAFFLRRFELLRKNPELGVLLFTDRLSQLAGPGGVREIKGRSVAFIRDCLRQAQAEGLVAPDLPVEMLVWVVRGTMRGAAVEEQTSPPEGLRGLEAEAVWDALETILRRSTPR